MNKTSSIFILAGVIILGTISYFVFRSETSGLPPNPSQAVNQSNKQKDGENMKKGVLDASPAKINVAFEYKNDGSVTTKAVRVEEGQTVIMNVISDVADEAHLHGYDKSVKLEPGKTATLEFIANKTGRFPVELEKLKKEIGIIEVYPK